jgi:hypothetical protein
LLTIIDVFCYIKHLGEERDLYEKTEQNESNMHDLRLDDFYLLIRHFYTNPSLATRAVMCLLCCLIFILATSGSWHLAHAGTSPQSFRCF